MRETRCECRTGKRRAQQHAHDAAEDEGGLVHGDDGHGVVPGKAAVEKPHLCDEAARQARQQHVEQQVRHFFAAALSNTRKQDAGDGF